MSVSRSISLLGGLVLLLPAIAACGGASSPSTSASGAAGATPPPASQPAGTTPEPTDGGGGGTTVSIPPIADAQYKTGKLHVEITGDVTTTLDVPLQGGLNFTSGDSTVLGYADPASGDGGGIVIGPGIIGVTISTKAVSTAGSNADANHCDVAITQSDATRLAGTFDCKRLLGVKPDGSQNVTVDIRGTFEAAR